jgi:hypothetical protein
MAGLASAEKSQAREKSAQSFFGEHKIFSRLSKVNKNKS